jgi:hypothetical protein
VNYQPQTDPLPTIEFTPYSSLLFMLFSVLGLRAIGEQTNDVEDTLTMWIIVYEPSFVKKDFSNRMAKGIPTIFSHTLMFVLPQLHLQ